MFTLWNIVYIPEELRHPTEGQDFTLSETERIDNIIAYVKSKFFKEKKQNKLYVPEALRHHTECQDFSLGEPERINNIIA